MLAGAGADCGVPTGKHTWSPGTEMSATAVHRVGPELRSFGTNGLMAPVSSGLFSRKIWTFIQELLRSPNCGQVINWQHKLQLSKCYQRPVDPHSQMQTGSPTDSSEKWLGMSQDIREKKNTLKIMTPNQCIQAALRFSDLMSAK